MHLWFALLLLAGPAPVQKPTAVAPDQPPGAEPPWDLLWMVGPRQAGPTRPAPRPTPALLTRGRTIYAARCALCHGEQGDGRGTVADKLRVRPTDFTKAVYKLRSTPSGTLPTDADLFTAVTRGVHGTPMRPWQQLEEKDRWAVVFHLKTFSPRFREERPGRPIRVPLAPRETEDLRDHGERLYIKYRCGACHGDAGAGDGPAREAYRARGNRDVRIRDFTRGRFIRGAEMEDLYLTLRAGIEGTPMSAYDALGDDELWALAAYVRLLVRERPLHQFPPAGTSLTGSTTAPAP